MEVLSRVDSLYSETSEEIISAPNTQITRIYSYNNDRFIGFIVNVKSIITSTHFQSNQSVFCFDFAIGDTEWTVNIDLQENSEDNDKYAHLYFILESGSIAGIIHQILDYSSINVSNWWEVDENKHWTSEDVNKIKISSLPTQINMILRYRRSELYQGIRKHSLNCSYRELDEIGQIQFSKPDYVVFKGNDWQLHARKQMLINASPVFEAMFQHNMKESKENIIKITDLSLNTTKTMLTFIYNGTFIVENESCIFELCKAADKYCLDNLKLVCDHEISLDLTEDNIVDRMIVAVMFKLPLSCAICSTFIRDNFRTIVLRDDWEKIAGHKESVLLITRRMGLLGCPALNTKN